MYDGKYVIWSSQSFYMCKYSKILNESLDILLITWQDMLFKNIHTSSSPLYDNNPKQSNWVFIIFKWSLSYCFVLKVFNVKIIISYSTISNLKINCFFLQTPGFFIKDKIKKFFVTQVISAPVVSGLVYIVKV